MSQKLTCITPLNQQADSNVSVVMSRWTRLLRQALASLGDAEHGYATRHPLLIPRPSRKAVDAAFWAIVTRQWEDAVRPRPGRRPQTPNAEF
jgi:hypothetical protein